MKLSFKELILIIVTVALLIVVGVGFWYDRTGALLDRTTHLLITDDKNLEVVKINKAGFLYQRSYYEAKIHIVDNRWEPYMSKIGFTYGGTGDLMSYDDYKVYEGKVLDKAGIKPEPVPGDESIIWQLAAQIDPQTGENIVSVIDTEADGNAYLYLYYSRK